MLKDSFILGNDNRALVEAITLFRLQLESGCYLDLDETFYVSSFRWNLVSVSCLDKSDYSYSFGNGKMNFQYSNMIGIGSLVDNLYKLILMSHILMNSCMQVIVVQSIN